MPGVCSEPGCPSFATNRGRCAAHQTTHPNGSRSGRDLVAHNRWARAVKKRDGYRCQRCGTTHDLQAHHIRPGYDLDAGITLCREHHAAVDPHATF
jgi:predicted restriction endonuclease